MTALDEPGRTARSMWTHFEPVHAVTYFHPRARAAYEAVGLRGYWRGYFAGRAAPLGATEAAPVIAAFFNFARRWWPGRCRRCGGWPPRRRRCGPGSPVRCRRSPS